MYRALCFVILAVLAGCAAPAGAVKPQPPGPVPPLGPTRVIILPDGRSFTCNVQGGAICPQP